MAVSAFGEFLHWRIETAKKLPYFQGDPIVMLPDSQVRLAGPIVFVPKNLMRIGQLPLLGFAAAVFTVGNGPLVSLHLQLMGANGVGMRLQSGFVLQ
jgi:hypothetical protein